MKKHLTNKLGQRASLALLCAALVGCGGDGDGVSVAAPGDNGTGSTGIDTTEGDPRSGTLAGGQLAADFAAATAATTNAVNGARPGSPLSFEDDDDDFAPAPPSIGADIPITYFGPAPSSVNRNLIGPFQLLTAGIVDLDDGDDSTVTLPLYQGRLASGGPNNGQNIWYIVTDLSLIHI